MNAPAQRPISEVQIRFSETEELAHSAFDRIIDDAQGGTVAIDIETTPNQYEIDRLAKLRLERAEATGRLKAEAKLKRPVGALKDEIKRLNAAIGNAAGAGLDPHRARIRLLQLYGGGTHVAVIDVDRTGLGVLRRLEDMRVVAHNAAFELAFLEKAGITPLETHCTLQTCRLVTGKRRPSLEFAAKEFLGVELDKTLQTSDWNATHLSTDQLRYAAVDAVVCFRLAQRTLLTLGPQASAYTIQMTALPAVVRMQLRGFRFDRDAHAALIEDLSRERIETIDAYVKACREQGVDDSVPATPERKRTILEAILTSTEIANWARTEKSHALSTRRSELKRAVHYPPIAALVRLSILDKAISAFGENYAESVSVVTGRIHSSYWVASTASGRASCTKPNLQQLPRDKRFRALFKAAPGCLLVVGDFNAMELRAAACISGDAAMTKAFEDGRDLHRITAAGMAGKQLEEVTDEERQRAKAVNFGGLYGQGAAGLTRAAWDNSSLVFTPAEAEQWVLVHKEAYPQLHSWKHGHAQRCKDAGRIIIGRDAARGIGRHYLEAWLPEGKSFYTRCCNLPVQGACADASMLALAYVDERLFEAGIDGGPVAWLHDEIVVEVCVEDADRAVEIIKQAVDRQFCRDLPRRLTQWTRRAAYRPELGRSKIRSFQAGKVAVGGGGSMILSDTATIKPEAKKVDFAASPTTPVGRKFALPKKRAPRGLVSIRLSASSRLSFSRPEARTILAPGWGDPALSNRKPHGDCQMNLRKKYGPTYPCDDDIYMSILDEAMERIITSEVEPSSIELALYMISRLGLDPKDLEPVEELAAIQLATAKNPQTIARYLAKKARRGAAASTRWWGPRH